MRNALCWQGEPLKLQSVRSQLVDMAKKNRRAAGAKRGIDINTDARPPAEANPAVVVQKPSNKRKSIAKLSSKQKARKKEKQRRGEAKNDQYSTKTVRDAKKLQRVLVAKALW